MGLVKSYQDLKQILYKKQRKKIYNNKGIKIRKGSNTH